MYNPHLESWKILPFPLYVSRPTLPILFVTLMRNLQLPTRASDPRRLLTGHAYVLFLGPIL